MEDYASNSKKAREQVPKAEKHLERVTTGEVIVQKKSLGRKFKELFIAADFRSVLHYIIGDVLLPAAQNTIVDASTKGIERMMYGERATQRRGYPTGPRITYNSPVSRSYNEIPRPPTQQRPGTSRYARSEFILASREEAALVLERMSDILEQFEAVSVADLNELVGAPSTHVDNKWGWTELRTVQINHIREGFLLDLPPAEPIQ